MEEITQQLAEEFNFKAKSIRKSKYMFICRNERQARIIKPSSQSCEQIIFIEGIKKRLLENDFKNIDKYYISSQGTPFFSCESGTYVMSDYMDYPEADFTSPVQMKKILKTVAELHRLGSGYGNLESCPEIILDKLEKAIKRLKGIKKIVCSQKKYSDFDISFIKHYEGYLQDALEAQEILNASKINILIEESIKRQLFCHNALKEENILFSGSSNEVFITNFDNATPQHYVFDLYQLIERYMRKHGEEYLSLEEILDIYFKNNEKDERIYPILFALLKFPFRFIKICDSFYNKKRNWVPNSTSKQLEELLSLKNTNNSYINTISRI